MTTERLSVMQGLLLDEILENKKTVENKSKGKDKGKR